MIDLSSARRATKAVSRPLGARSRTVPRASQFRFGSNARRADKLLSCEAPSDPCWLAALEEQMEEHGAQIAVARARTVRALEDRLEAAPEDEFARATITIEGWQESQLSGQLRGSRDRDAAAGEKPRSGRIGRTSSFHRGKQMEAARSSTGEQKALLLGLVLAHAELVTDVGFSRPSCCSMRWRRTSTQNAARRFSRGLRAEVRSG